MSDEDQPKKSESAGIPAWVMTFADLMSLLMCFFVLLLSFSEMDALKYKRMAGSMSNAFGVQNRIEVYDIPKGTSVIAQDFSPGKPEPTPIQTVNQITMEETNTTVEIICKSGATEGERSEQERMQIQRAEQDAATTLEAKEIEEVKSDAKKVKETLTEEVNGGKVEVESRGKKIIIRIKENGSFPSGSATLRPEFLPIMAKMREVIRNIPGHFYIEGHTDDVPINTLRFRSNWELSASRAVSVAHELFRDGALSPQRVTILGHADTHPLQPNIDSFSRAKNRRVEIIIEQGEVPAPQSSHYYEAEQFGDKDLKLKEDTAKQVIQDKLDAIEERQNIDKTIREAEAREAPRFFEFSPDEIF